jgi:tetratricopeptide (TPR) repeat protein
LTPPTFCILLLTRLLLLFSGEEAIDAYYKALELKPSFVRCRYNLGVSCINIGCYKEAAEHLLGALSLHVTGNGHSSRQANVSDNLWETLRRTFIQVFLSYFLSIFQCLI